MYGIICRDHMPGHSLFANFRLALKNYFKTSFKEVLVCENLEDVTTLFIVDEHFGPHVDVWKNDKFINTVNEKNIKVVVFNFEKIYSSQFPWNASHQSMLCRFSRLVQFVSDVHDAKTLNKSVINKQFLSKDTTLDVDLVDKKDRIVFIGQCNGFYPTRSRVLNSFNSLGLPLDIIITDRKLSYKEFLTKLSEYKYMLNPLGTGTFINLRFYEAIKLGCIPIQEITEEMKPWYPELSSCITFTNVDSSISTALDSFKQPPSNIYLEDYFDEINLSNHVNG